MPALLFAAASAMMISGCRPEVAAPRQESSGVLKVDALIAHAMGGIDDMTYTNSLEAFEYNYRLGRRVFEVDLIMTGDGRVVCMHDGLERWMGLKNKIDDTPFVEFNRSRIFGKYTPIDLDELLLIMKKHPDVYIVTDTKGDIGDLFERIVARAKELAPAALGRIIPQIYRPEDLYAVSRLYPFGDVILTLYRTDMTDDEVARFVKESSVSAVTMSEERFNEGLVRRLASEGIPSFVHTINDPEKVAYYRARGVHGFYTDFYLE